MSTPVSQRPQRHCLKKKIVVFFSFLLADPEIMPQTRLDRFIQDPFQFGSRYVTPSFDVLQPELLEASLNKP
jgi:hypothetical protein